MSKLNNLLQDLCPNGVKYVKLKDIATDIFRGAGITREQVTTEGTPCVRYGEIYTTYGVFFDACVSHTNEEILQSRKYFEHGDILFAITGESVEEIAKSTAYVGYEKCLAGGDIVVMKHNQNPKYLGYVLSTTESQNQKSKGKVKSKVVHSSVPAIKEIIIPLPPLPIQEEIVRILDSYTKMTEELESKLKAELEARKKQYEFYRDSLLKFDTGGGSSECIWKPLGEIATIVRGASPRPIKNYITKNCNGINWIKIGDVLPHSKYIISTEEKITVEGANKSRPVHKGDFILSNSMSFGRPYILEIEGCIHDGWLSMSRFENYVSADYLYYILSSEPIQSEMKKRASFGGAIKNLNSEIVKSIEIPMPTKKEQERIVKILDRFDKLCNDLTVGLPAEIESRRKQYEYYRDKLLTFTPAQ